MCHRTNALTESRVLSQCQMYAGCEAQMRTAASAPTACIPSAKSTSFQSILRGQHVCAKWFIVWAAQKQAHRRSSSQNIRFNRCFSQGGHQASQCLELVKTEIFHFPQYEIAGRAG